jgi:hypothetical protein
LLLLSALCAVGCLRHDAGVKAGHNSSLLMMLPRYGLLPAPKNFAGSSSLLRMQKFASKQYALPQYFHVRSLDIFNRIWPANFSVDFYSLRWVLLFTMPVELLLHDTSSQLSSE